MDPAVLLASPRRIREEVKAILAAFGRGTGHVFNLGHGITPEVKPEHVSVLAEAVHEMSLPYHAA
jgi:uroporphyrinogen decarboxylase